MHSDHFHPGWNVIRATVAPLRRKTSILVLSGVRVSSGVSNDFELTPAITDPPLPCTRAHSVRCPSTGPVIEQGQSRRRGDGCSAFYKTGFARMEAHSSSCAVRIGLHVGRAGRSSTHL